MNTTQKKSNEPQMDNGLHKLFMDELAHLLNAEQQLTNALPKMAAAANLEELSEAFTSHLAETEGHITRLKQVFASLGAKAASKNCKAMKVLIEEADQLMEDELDSAALDAALIIAAQKFEHYEIASYGTVCAWAAQMGHTYELDLLMQNLEEEKTADDRLTDIAETTANKEAEARS